MAGLNPLRAELITGANGKQIDFAGVFEATPAGLVAVTTITAEAITIPWDKLDLAALEKNNPFIAKVRAEALRTNTSQPIRTGLGRTYFTPEQARISVRAAVSEPFFMPFEVIFDRPDFTADGRRYTTTDFRGLSPHKGQPGPSMELRALARLASAKTESEKFQAQGSVTMLRSTIEALETTLAHWPPDTLFPPSTKDTTLKIVTETFVREAKKSLDAQIQAELSLPLQTAAGALLRALDYKIDDLLKN
jgi:hypothetical protein